MPTCYDMVCNPMHFDLAKFYYCKKWVLHICRGSTKVE
jgi:hypothetical protein